MKYLYLILFSLSTEWLSSQSFNSDQYWNVIEINNMKNINTEGEEFSPIVWGNQFIYVGQQDRGTFLRRQSTSYFDLKSMPLDSKTNIVPTSFSKELNSKWHEGPIGFYSKEKKIFFTKANQDLEGIVVDNYDRLLLQIYQAVYQNGKWKKIKKCVFSSPDANYCHPTISEDGNFMIFASSQDLSIGKMDLYMAKRKGSNWSKDIHLGQDINSEDNEWFPFIFGKEHLFYSSDRDDGQGLDIYYCTIDQDGNISNHYRLPKPINSRYDDFGFFLNIDGKSGYLSSNRPGGAGKDDIYKFQIIQQENKKSELASNISTEQNNDSSSKSIRVQSIKLKVIDLNSHIGLANSRLKIYPFDDNVSVDFLNLMSENADLIELEKLAKQTCSPIIKTTQSNGKIEIELQKGKQAFIVVEKDGYKADWNYIHTRHNIESIVFELQKSM